MVNHMNTEKNELTVFEAHARDVGRGIARIDNEIIEKLGLPKGDIIEIKGKRRTVARCLPPLTGSQLAVERMQFEQARKQIHKTHFEEKNNFETGFDWTCRDPLDAQKVPARSIRIDGLTRNNAGIAIGDTVLIRKIQSTRAEKVTVTPLESIPPIDERYLADALEAVPVTKGDNVMIPYLGGRLTFQVVDTEPHDDVVIDQKTLITITTKNPSAVLMNTFVYTTNHFDSEKLEKLKTSVEQYEKELLAKQDEIKHITRNMLKENHKIEDINKFLNSNRNESLISTLLKLLDTYRKYVAELESTISRK
jgi:transitional endoplasmic reticulum ATPase